MKRAKRFTEISKQQIKIRLLAEKLEAERTKLDAMLETVGLRTRDD